MWFDDMEVDSLKKPSFVDHLNYNNRYRKKIKTFDV